MAMTTKGGMVLLTLFLAMTGVSSASDQSPPKPLRPPETIPPFNYNQALTICVNCDQPFDFPSHVEANAAILKSPYVQELRKAMYWQDTFHQFESKVHFDNCDFEGASGYIDELWAEVEKEISSAKLEDQKDVRQRVKNAFFSLGQILHAVQDFYAHTNFVEMFASTVQKVTDLEIIRPWTTQGKGRIEALRTGGLFSGYVFWGFPKKCAAETPSHAELAKDSKDTQSGKVKISHLENLSQHRIALFLAREASKDLLEDAFKQWPLLAKTNGRYVGFEMLIDRRDL